MEYLTYSLISSDDPIDDSRHYYATIANYTEAVLSEANNSEIINVVLDYQNFLAATGLEKVRSRSEYILEALLIGVLWNEYIQHAVAFSPYFNGLFALLRSLRNIAVLKPLADFSQGVAVTVLLTKKADKDCKCYSISDFSKLIQWLSATNDFAGQVIRIKKWEKFFKSVPAEVGYLLKMISDFGAWFSEKSQVELGSFTQNVNSFLNTNYHKRRWREDLILCGRSEAQYHLSMIGAEIMNRAFREDFLKAKNKTVLLPACMSKNTTSCRAVQDKRERVCVGCTGDCAVKRLRDLGNKHGFSILVVPHSFEYKRYLRIWSGHHDTGFIGVSCVLNLLEGGYAMKHYNLAGQCVLLDYCGCSSHWYEAGGPTNLDEHQLLRLIK